MVLKSKRTVLFGLVVAVSLSLLWAAGAAAQPTGDRPWRAWAAAAGICGPGAGLEDAAEVLGMTVEELMAAKAGGKTVAEIAAEKGISRETLIERIMALREERLADLVALGKISQEQAARILEAVELNVEAMVDRSCGGQAYCGTGSGCSGRAGGKGPGASNGRSGWRQGCCGQGAQAGRSGGN